jgi:hypothetical protein
VLFSDQIFEAIITEIDYDKGTCSISPIDANTGSIIDNVPIPHFAGNGNAGLFYGINVGTRVVAMFTSAQSRNVTVITGLTPNQNLFSSVFNRRKPLDAPSGTIPYPKIKSGEVIIRGSRGAEVSLLESGNVNLKSANGGGLYLNKVGTGRTSMLSASSDIVNYTNASKVVSGPVRRMSGIIKNLYPKPDLTQTPLFADPDYAKNASSKGFFVENIPLKRSYRKRKRNPEISEYRMVINEFSTDYMFTGFDDEVDRATGSIGTYNNSETHDRNREQGNTLHLAEHELIEIIGGNLVDINGNILDLNYRPLVYGDENRVPTTQLDINYDRARRISRRGIGYHFQLSTNTRSDDPSESKSNFVFDIDKEGLLKVNIPASSDTGNIPFASNANYVGEGDSVEVSYLNETDVEPVPVTLRDENGEAVYPGKNAGGITHRKTGIRYSIGQESPYFPTPEGASASEVRVNPTRYHNMYAAAERLIANTIKIINIPVRFADDNGFPEGMSILKPFEVPIPDSMNVAESLDQTALRETLGQGSTDFPTYMSVIAVEPGPPAIYHGGGRESGSVGALIAGKLYIDESGSPPYSNAFNSSKSGKEIEADIADGEEEARPVGGKSAHLNFDGSIEASVGKDNFDQKSIVLDTAGSIISWLGKDAKGRSMVMQTDGDVLLNVGGSYEGTDLDDRQMNKGRFELRVNVTDKKFVASRFSGEDTPVRGGNPGPESDYIISISETGLVIAGMKSGAPMIMRNDGPILIESSSSDVTLKGIQVKTVGPKGVINVIKPPTRNT